MSDKWRPHLAVAELAGKQHGVVSSRQLRRLGYSRSVISREAARGRLHFVHQGVYSVGHAAISRQGRCLAAVLSCGIDTVLSHRSAAWLWGFTARWTETVEVTGVSPRRSRRTIGVYSSRRLLSGDRTQIENVPVTAAPRTLLDFAAVDPDYLPQALNNAVRLDLLDLPELDALTSRSRGQRGVARLRAALDLHRDPAFTRSGLERRFLRLVREAGLPRPSTNLFLEGYEIDMYWQREMFAVELDTFDYHGDRGSFESDRIRQEDLKLAGIEMTRITGARLDREPTAVMQRLKLLLAHRRDRDLLPLAQQKARSATR